MGRDAMDSEIPDHSAIVGMGPEILDSGVNSTKGTVGCGHGVTYPDVILPPSTYPRRFC